MTWTAIFILALSGGSAAAFGPRMIARLPEPAQPDNGKPKYAQIATEPGLRVWLGGCGATLGMLAGLGIERDWSYLPWVYLLPIGVVLAYIDLRTRLLPTRIIGPSYLVVGGLIAVAVNLAGDIHLAFIAAGGWLGYGGTYFLIWLVFPRGMGYGDVRLAGLLGLALGAIGWQTVLIGAWMGMFLGGLSGIAIGRMTGMSANAHGPAMVIGSVLGIAIGQRLLS